MLTPVDDVPRAFCETLVEAFAARQGPRFALVLSGGETARHCYELLAEADGIEWPLVDIYVGDERFVPADDEHANQRLIHESLLDRVASGVGDPGGAGGPAFHPMPTEGGIEECAAAYQRVMADLVRGPGIDLIHLGLGPDGHTASLFPGAPSLDAEPGQLVLHTEDPNENNPFARLTLTLPAINSARLALFTVAGDEKADALARVVRGDDLPAARVHAGRTVWLADAAARSRTP